MKSTPLFRTLQVHPKQNVGYRFTPILSEDERFLKRVQDTVLKNINNERFDCHELARKVHLSISQLNRKLNALTNRPAGQLIRETRLDYAADLLTARVARIGEIALEVGFSNQAHFCRSFKRRFRCTPTTFQKNSLLNYKLGASQ